jgi:hypothetical protein
MPEVAGQDGQAVSSGCCRDCDVREAGRHAGATCEAVQAPGRAGYNGVHRKHSAAVEVQDRLQPRCQQRGLAPIASLRRMGDAALDLSDRHDGQEKLLGIHLQPIQHRLTSGGIGWGCGRDDVRVE